MTATEAKTEFGRALATVGAGGVVYITKNSEAKAVLISVEKFKELSRSSESRLNRLSEEFDAMVARMQTPKAAAAVDALFRATPRELGRASVAGVRKHG